MQALILSFWPISDIDECSKESHPCDKNANCTNREGSFICVCKPGFTGDGSTCTGMFTICLMASKWLNLWTSYINTVLVVHHLFLRRH